MEMLSGGDYMYLKYTPYTLLDYIILNMPLPDGSPSNSQESQLSAAIALGPQPPFEQNCTSYEYFTFLFSLPTEYLSNDPL